LTKEEINNISEKELIEKCSNNERYYQEILYRKYADKMFTVAKIYSHNEQDACDILQDSFLTIFKYINNFRFEGSFEGWIRKITINTAFKLYHKKTREQENKNEFIKSIETKINDIIENINANEIIEMVNALPEKAGLVLKLHIIEGYKHKEIAELLGINEGTSKSQLNRARSLLIEQINKKNG
jgi:RNA polymerase sigma factor (sigma-70 family)